MGEFTLDTSGDVTILPHQSPSGMAAARYWRWTDLDPFTQGYVEALFASTGLSVFVTSYQPRKAGPRYDESRPAAFSDLAPETLAAILKDCADYTSRPFGTKDITDLRPDSTAGGRFWRKRQERFYDAFPPLTPYLGDDGRVYLREGA